jgi:hypothetical protein
VTFESLDIRDGGEGALRWTEAGRPVVPSLVVGGETTPILHVSQLAAALGLPAPRTQEVRGLALETVTVLESWLGRVRPLDIDVLTAPTASRGRSLRNLTTNVFHPFELLPAAWTTSSFPWEPDHDDEREAQLATAREVVAYAERILAGWSGFVRARGEELDGRDPVVVSPRGNVRFSALVDSQLRHARFHHEQLVDFLRQTQAM